MLYGPIWVDSGQLLNDGVAFSRHSSPDRTGLARLPYAVYHVTEAQIEGGLAIARERAISAEPSGSAGLGFLDALETIDPAYDPERSSVLVINTGNGIDQVNK